MNGFGGSRTDRGSKKRLGDNNIGLDFKVFFYDDSFLGI